jgi:hypothetical protein
MKQDSVIEPDGDRRSGWDRRCFSYTHCLPERRSGKDRREGYGRAPSPETTADPEDT